MSAVTARLVLEAIARALPLDAHDAVTRVDIRDGWGGAVHVRVHTSLARHQHADLAGRLRAAVADTLTTRHMVEVVWGT